MATKGSGNDIIANESSCERCAASVCDTVKQLFSCTTFSEVFKESSLFEVNAAPSPNVSLDFLDFESSEESPHFFNCYHDAQLVSLMMLPNQTETTFYKALLKEIVHKRRVLIAPYIWAETLLRALPSLTATVDASGRGEAIFRGNKDIVDLILREICEVKISLPGEVWTTALLQAGPRHVYYPSSEQYPCGQQYFLGDLHMTEVVLKAIHSCKVFIPVQGCVQVLSILKESLHVKALSVFCSNMLDSQISNFLIYLVSNSKSDISLLFFFSEALSWLVKNKNSRELEQILSVFSNLKGFEFDRKIQIMELMINNDIPSLLVQKIFESERLVLDKVHRMQQGNIKSACSDWKLSIT